MDRLGKRYKLDISKNEMKRLGFRFDYELDDYVYKFPVYRYGRIPVLFANLDFMKKQIIYGLTYMTTMACI